ncbi:hypothetical protein KUV24_07410, partial [Nitratireductor sp. DP7N14-4]|nr:hypothetical protein [Nitratireductor sp. DP7N14-4]
RRCKRETLVGLRPPDVPRLQRKVDYFCAAQWPTFTPPLTDFSELSERVFYSDHSSSHQSNVKRRRNA